MAIPKTAEERFYYYFNQANSLDEKYQKKIDNINREKYDFEVTEDSEYKAITKQNKEEMLDNVRKYEGEYADYSLGYDNSMQDVAKKQAQKEENEKNLLARNAIERENRANWEKQKADRIANLKNRYAKEFENAIYNMQKANEESMM